MNIVVEPARALIGHVTVPGDKSVSHRAVLLGAIADGETEIAGFGRAGDTDSTISAVRALGVEVDERDVDQLTVRGVGLRGLRPPDEPIDCGNAGTLMRLLAGILAGQEGRFELVGDESLSRRPMDRVADPLRKMRARIETTDGHAPVVVEGGPLKGIRYELPVASAQVKSATLLAGLFAEGRTTVVEPIATRDHTELMLVAAGVGVDRRAHNVTVEGIERLELGRVDVPGDFSSAAPLIVAACLVPGSQLYVHNVGVNPTRTGLLDVLERMRARVTVFNRRRLGGEPVADIEARSSSLVATSIDPGEVPRLVDELPLVALAAGMARGQTVVRGAQELRVKETDRLESVKELLRPLGIRMTTSEDGLRVAGVPSRPKGGGVAHAGGDHRLAILGAVAGLVSREGVRIEGAEAAAISFPGFFELLESVSKR
ncbi:MAG TPA: 3-phosphoshikimate 1-carboxyvinyltransferase [Gaiellaceae bacterium]|nr:3-phosphoshikimate 1-carboxyvinyltransferase [Gaiellaceae bacterium]